MDSVTPLAHRLPVLSPEYFPEEHQGTYFLAPTEGNSRDPLPINSTGAAILARIGDGLDFGAVCESLRADFPGAPEDIDHDVAGFLWKLEDQGLIRWKQ